MSESERPRAADILASEQMAEAGRVPQGLVVRPTLTPEERRFLSVAAVAASSEVDDLIAIIERLTGEKVIPANEPHTEPQTG